MGVKKHGFTLIELVVAIGVFLVVLPTVFAILFAILRQQLQLYSLQEIKRQGDNVAAVMKNLLSTRFANLTTSSYTVESCSAAAGQTNLYGVDHDGYRIHFYLDGSGVIASAAASVLPSPRIYQLTGSAVTITNLSFLCSRANSFSPPIVTVRFTVTKGTAPFLTSLQYSFKARLRNY